MKLKDLRQFIHSCIALDGETEVSIIDEYDRAEVKDFRARSYKQTCSMGHQHDVVDIAIVMDGRIR